MEIETEGENINLNVNLNDASLAQTIESLSTL